MPYPAATPLDRRQFMAAVVAGGLSVATIEQTLGAPDKDSFTLRYLVASSMYGYASLDDVLPEVSRLGSTAIDLWPKPHGSQREELDALGEEKFAQLLAQHKVSLGCLTQYRAGPFALEGEMKLAHRLGCELIVTAVPPAQTLVADEVKPAIIQLIEQLKPQLAIADELGITLALENHPRNPLDTADSLKWFAELRPSKRLAIAFSPYHLNLDGGTQADLLREIGPAVALFYAWQHGMGSKKALPREQELLQMPGRGPLDFVPMLESLRSIGYHGWTEIFMHPFPRGKPILPTVDEVTAEINRSRRYLTKCLQ